MAIQVTPVKGARMKEQMSRMQSFDEQLPHRERNEV